jgi:hypothetical protein
MRVTDDYTTAIEQKLAFVDMVNNALSNFLRSTLYDTLNYETSKLASQQRVDIIRQIKIMLLDSGKTNFSQAWLIDRLDKLEKQTAKDYK